MHLRYFSWLLFCAIIAAIPARAQTTSSPIVGGAELILVAKVSGTVTKTLNGVTAPLAKDDRVEQKAKITTGNNSSAVLAFSNGATLRLEHNSELVIEEYLQDPFTTAVKVADLKKEPSKSRTRLGLNRGELVGDVKPLDHAGGSEFTVQTPVGAAGIRGTIFRIVFRPDGTGQAFFTLSTAVGSVVYTQGDTGGTAAQGPTVTGTGTAGVPVPQGQEIAITVDVTQNAQGQLVVTVVPPVNAASNISPSNQLSATNAAQEIATAVELTVFTPGAGGTTSGSTTGGTTTVRGPNFTADVKTEPPPPPPADNRIIPTNPGVN